VMHSLEIRRRIKQRWDSGLGHVPTQMQLITFDRSLQGSVSHAFRRIKARISRDDVDVKSSHRNLDCMRSCSMYSYQVLLTWACLRIYGCFKLGREDMERHCKNRRSCQNGTVHTRCISLN